MFGGKNPFTAEVWFVNKLETNITNKKYIGVDNHSTAILRKYTIKQTETKEDSPLDV